MAQVRDASPEELGPVREALSGTALDDLAIHELLQRSPACCGFAGGDSKAWIGGLVNLSGS